jgi:membrane protease YdiL (CAAX protease family)
MEKVALNIRHIALPIVIGSVGLLSMTLIAQLLNHEVVPLIQMSQHKIVNHTFTMQIMVLPISFVALAIVYLYNRQSFKKFFRFSFKQSNDSNNWSLLGPILAVAITLGNTLLMSAAVASEHGVMNTKFVALIPWVLFFSISNAWSEEIFARFVVVAGLDGKLNTGTICIISAIMFGVPHFFGTPGGFFGVIVTGALGWILAKSVVESRGLGWALLIHFLQDVVIFGAGSMIVAGNS